MSGASKISHRRNMSTVGQNIVHGRGYLNIYQNPSLGLNGPRSAGKKRAARNKKETMTSTLPAMSKMIDVNSNESQDRIVENQEPTLSHG